MPAGGVDDRAASRNYSGFRPDVQGLRALAVTLVVVYHLYPSALPGGYIGVDVFFVISGYLITGLLVRGAQRGGRVDLLGFYARRARRLLPAAVLVLTVTWFAAREFLPVTQLHDTATQIRASALYLQNWVLAHNSVDYLKAEAAPTPVQHFWSLSVEEQFYLVWPLIVVVAVLVAAWVRRREPKAYQHRVMRAVALLLAAGVVAASLVYSLHETNADPAAAYFQTTTRMWELGLGGVLALLPRGVSDRVGRFGLLAWTGFALILASAFVDNAHTPFPGTAALVPVIGAGLMLMCGSSAARLGTARFTSVRPAVFIGDLSYSIYLWHWPMIVIWKAYAGPSLRPLDGLGIAAAAVLAAYLSTRFVETPIRNGAFITRSRVRGLAVATLAIIPVSLASVFLTDQAAPAANRIDASHAGAQIVQQAPIASSQRKPTTHEPENAPPVRPLTIQWLPASAAHTGLSPTSSKIIPSLANVASDYGRGSGPGCKATDFETSVKICTFGDTVHPTKTVALVGDSHAAQWSSALATIASEQHWKLVELTHDSCTFGTAELVLQNQSTWFRWCNTWARNALRQLTTTIKPDIAIVTARVNAGTVQHHIGDATSFAEIGKGEVTYWKQLIAAGISVVAIHETPEPGKNIPDCLAARGATVDSCATSTRTALIKNTPIDVASKIMGATVPVINMNGYLCTRTVCPAVVGDVIVYRDKHHLTDTYASSVVSFLRGELLGIPALAGS